MFPPLRSLLIAVLVAAAGAASIAAEVHVGGVLDSGGRWDVAHSPYIVDRTLVVPHGQSLVIGPGTRIVISRLMPHRDDASGNGIALIVEGSLVCAGSGEARIRFVPADNDGGNIGWQGIELRDGPGVKEIAFTDITGAASGITVSGCRPSIRAAIIERNGVGVDCRRLGSAIIRNCILTGNFVAAIRVTDANPVVENSLIGNNPGSGLWGDGTSVVTCAFNCIYANADGNYLDCEPALGRMAARNANGDSVDKMGNLACDPAFAGTEGDSLAGARFRAAKVDTWGKIRRKIGEVSELVVYGSIPARAPSKEAGRFSLSPYSPCRHAGDPAAEFRNWDGSRNDMGIYGGSQ
jgi:hypothetical protein